MTTEAILAQLTAGQRPVAELDAPDGSGVYGMFLTPGASVPGIAQPGQGPIYVGTSDNLAQREFDTHFAAGQSGFSTLRRSLGALLLEDLNLQPRPRGSRAKESNYRCYRFDDQGEQRLTGWMEQRLRVAVHELTDPKAVEKELIGLACPPLNLTGWANPDRSAIKAARKACVEMARQADSR